MIPTRGIHFYSSPVACPFKALLGQKIIILGYLWNQNCVIGFAIPDARPSMKKNLLKIHSASFKNPERFPLNFQLINLTPHSPIPHQFMMHKHCWFFDYHVQNFHILSLISFEIWCMRFFDFFLKFRVEKSNILYKCHWISSKRWFLGLASRSFLYFCPNMFSARIFPLRLLQLARIKVFGSPTGWISIIFFMCKNHGGKVGQYFFSANSPIPAPPPPWHALFGWLRKSTP